MNRDEALVAKLEAKVGDRLHVTIARGGKAVFSRDMPDARTFGDVPEGAPLLYRNSLMNVSFALNQGDFAKAPALACGAEWSVDVEKAPR